MLNLHCFHSSGHSHSTLPFHLIPPTSDAHEPRKVNCDFADFGRLLFRAALSLPVTPTPRPHYIPGPIRIILFPSLVLFSIIPPLSSHPSHLVKLQRRCSVSGGGPSLLLVFVPIWKGISAQIQ